MSKKIVISESQYRRVFLSEQNDKVKNHMSWLSDKPWEIHAYYLEVPICEELEWMDDCDDYKLYVDLATERGYKPWKKNYLWEDFTKDFNSLAKQIEKVSSLGDVGNNEQMRDLWGITPKEYNDISNNSQKKLQDRETPQENWEKNNPNKEIDLKIIPGNRNYSNIPTNNQGLVWDFVKQEFVPKIEYDIKSIIPTLHDAGFKDIETWEDVYKYSLGRDIIQSSLVGPYLSKLIGTDTKQGQRLGTPIKDPDLQWALSKNIVLNERYEDFNKAITNFNRLLPHYNKLRKTAGWSQKPEDGVVMLNRDLIDKNKDNDLERLFNRQYGKGDTYEGIGSTNIYNPRWVIDEYIKVERSLLFDYEGMIKQETFEREVSEAREKYDKEIKIWQKKYNVWASNVKKRWDEHTEAVDKERSDWLDAENEKFSALVPLDALRVEPPTPIYLNTNPNKLLTNKFYVDEKTGTKYKEPKKYKKYNINKEEPDDIKDFQDWLDSQNLKWVNGTNLNKGPGYGNFGPLTTKNYKLYGPYYEASKIIGIVDPPKAPNFPNILRKKVRDPEEMSNMENYLIFLKNLVSAIHSYNQIMWTQSSNSITQWCDTNKKAITYRGLPVGGKEAEFNSAYIVYEKWSKPSSWVEANAGYRNLDERVIYSWYLSPVLCPSYGGVWVYSAGENSSACGCIRTPNKNINQIDDLSKIYKDIKNRTDKSYVNSNLVETLKGKLQYDTRDWDEKLSDWAEGCWDDWHCLADIASIAVLFLNIPFPGLGTGLSLAIDLVSGAGYIAEQKEGWALNAGLTLLGGAFSGFETMKYVKSIGKGGIDVAKLTKALNNGLKEAEKLTTKAEFKALTEAEKSIAYSKEFRKSLKGLSSKELKDLGNLMTNFSKNSDELVKTVNDIVGDMSKLSKAEQASMDEILNKMSKNKNLKREIADFILENGGKVDAKKIITKFGSKGFTKDAIIQTAFFGLVQAFPEETATAIKGGINLIDSIPGIDGALKELLGMKDSGGGEDPDSILLSQRLEELATYGPTIDALKAVLNGERYATILEEYDIQLEKDLIEYIVNGKDSIMGNPLTNALNMLQDFVSIEKTMKDEGKSYEEIKEKLQSNYNSIVQYLKDEGKKDNVINLLEKEKESWTEEEINNAKELGLDVEKMSITFY